MAEPIQWETASITSQLAIQAPAAKFLMAIDRNPMTESQFSAQTPIHAFYVESSKGKASAKQTSKVMTAEIWHRPPNSRRSERARVFNIST
ncbi:hypothetical protein LNV09_14460 [Paucibacter sp. B2R-40]|uniref:hypothetical protein n=1 Tax=Paucibacter sp. B2R-40 TaxID=2893554 RepID=UPI0021E3C6BA|nr:hypothetical protein [Paucibacter sp. B2R-40]MCV2355353.1 hypothetical protein [Paucibacter sp. B2R-40]